MRWAAVLSCILLGACSTTQSSNALAVYQPPAGSNLVLEGPIAAVPGHHMVIGDLVATPGMVIPRHSHSGEEFLFVMGGSGTLSIDGKPDVLLKAGQGVRIAPGEVHGGTAGPDGMRAVSSWVVANGQPLRTAAP